MPTRVIVIGAGWAGLAAAKTYLQVNPFLELTILSDDTSVGGVWSKNRIYPGLIANSPNSLYEFSDLSMVDDEHPAFELIPGAQVQSYLEKYAIKFDLLRRIQWNSKVVKARRLDRNSGWTLELSSGQIYTCDKLIVATGLHSKPRWPSIPSENYDGIVMHSKSLGAQHQQLSQSDKISHVAIVGGCKSAIEAANIFLAAGKHVSWIVRPSEQGVPIVVIDPKTRPNLVALNNTRLFAIFSPSIFSTSGFWYSLLHSRSWAAGRWLHDAFWARMSASVHAGVGYDHSANARAIEPSGARSLFWNAPYLSLLYTDNPFLESIHDPAAITVYRDTPVKLVDGAMFLSSGERVPADGVVYCTGWEPSVDFFAPADAATLGIPIPVHSATTNSESVSITATSEASWASLAPAADAAVTAALPFLATSTSPTSPPAYTPFRLYRQVVSPATIASHDHSIAFVGVVSTSQTSVACELTALWGVAWLEGLLSPLPPQSPEKEATEEEEKGEAAALACSVAAVTAWMARRYGSRGARDPEIVLEIQTFFDALATDLGVGVFRKRQRAKGRGWLAVIKGWFAEYLAPYTARDYTGIVDEFLRSVQERKARGEARGTREEEREEHREDLVRVAG